MADDERSESSDAVFDPGDSSQVRKAVQNGYVPPAPKVPALKAPAPPPVAGSIARGKAPPAKKPTEAAAAAAAASAVTKASEASEAKSAEHATADGVAEEDSEDESVSKPGHVVPALGAADPEASSDPSTASGVRATDDPRPRLPIDAQPKRAPTIPARRRAEPVTPPANADADDELEPSPFGERGSVEIELPEGFDDPGSHSMRLSLPQPVARFGRYDVLGRLATGGMAEIYLAQEPIQGGGIRIVVLKVLRKQLANDDEFEQLFLREGRVAMQLAHPHISTVFEFGKWGGHFFIAMEYVEGATLKDILERVGLHGERLEPEVAVGIVAKVAGALDYAHTARDAHRKSLGVVHRDVSPHNLMVRYDGVVKLLDFGVAKVAQSEDESRSDAVKGKFGYLAPEQCRADAVDGRTDVFGLGVCLWEALTGRRLYKRGSQYDTFRAILEEPPPSIRELLPELPEDLDVLVRKALAKSPDDRFSSAGEMQEALESWLTKHGSIATAARLRRKMAELFADEIRSGPQLEVDSKVHERLRATSIHPPLSTSDRPPPMDAALAEAAPAAAAPRSKTAWVAAALVATALGVGTYFAFGSRGPVEPSEEQVAAEAAREEARLEAERQAREQQQAEREAAREEAARAAAEREAAAADRAAAEEAALRAAAEREAAERAAAEAAARAEEERRREPRTPREPRRRPGFVADPGF